MPSDWLRGDPTISGVGSLFCCFSAFTFCSLVNRWRTIIFENGSYGFRPSKDHKKLLTRKVGGEDTIDVFGNVMFYEGKSICTLEWMPLELFSAYLEKLINSIKMKSYAREI